MFVCLSLTPCAHSAVALVRIRQELAAYLIQRSADLERELQCSNLLAATLQSDPQAYCNHIVGLTFLHTGSG